MKSNIPALLILLIIVVLFLIILILIVGFKSVKADNREQEMQEIDEQLEDKQNRLNQVSKQLDNRTKTRSAKVIDTLDWMLSMGIIDASEYNHLLMKSLPFV